ncbi:hypothetical protein [Vibrio barjaei]|uniref:hypothetical protein n=1 Tax=Vibrio barjaei TaxID=1676683 RepID=UPI002283E4A0|nr:hypothetical protein [Vibrio barjaei]MCY9874621.1 hypothetical protein [Vibrio barjaei]
MTTQRLIDVEFGENISKALQRHNTLPQDIKGIRFKHIETNRHRCFKNEARIIPLINKRFNCDASVALVSTDRDSIYQHKVLHRTDAVIYLNHDHIWHEINASELL